MKDQMRKYKYAGAGILLVLCLMIFGTESRVMAESTDESAGLSSYLTDDTQKASSSDEKTSSTEEKTDSAGENAEEKDTEKETEKKKSLGGILQEGLNLANNLAEDLTSSSLQELGADALEELGSSFLEDMDLEALGELLGNVADGDLSELLNVFGDGALETIADQFEGIPMSELVEALPADEVLDLVTLLGKSSREELLADLQGIFVPEALREYILGEHVEDYDPQDSEKLRSALVGLIESALQMENENETEQE